ncbi:tetratricopeptide repeat protein [uncultured Microscilla sp.]|uniref:tetratricopeptide repeat protein n=1 Tax=uncultured Microscilla sp. TaxID=432653 RepID=UPI00262356E1|nr:tetratricopeptide repeat protein [uncultured Microscilla sp.]
MEYLPKLYHYLLCSLLVLSITSYAQVTELRTLDDRTKTQQQLLQTQQKTISDQQKMIYDLRDKLAHQETAIKVLESEQKAKEDSLYQQIHWNINALKIIAGFIVVGIILLIWQRNFLGRHLLGVWIEENFKESIRYYLKDMIQRKVRDRDVREIVREKGEAAVAATVTKYIKETDIADIIHKNARPEIDRLIKVVNEEVAENLKGKVPTWEQDFAHYLELGARLADKTQVLNETLTFPAETKLEIQEYKKVLLKLKNAPDYTPEDWYLKGIEEYETGHLKDARESFNEVLHLNAEDTNAMLFKGATHSDNAEYKSAIKIFNQALTLEPQNKIALILHANTAFKMKKYDKAIENYDQIQDLDADYAYSYYGKGNAYKEKGDYQLAIENYRVAIEKDDDFALAYLSITELLIVSENYEEAHGYLSKLSEFADLKIRDQILAKYFELIIKKIRHLGTTQSEADFEELLLNEIDVYWDMSKIDKWLTITQLDKDDLLFITNKTKVMKKRIKQGEVVES